MNRIVMWFVRWRLHDRFTLDEGRVVKINDELWVIEGFAAGGAWDAINDTSHEQLSVLFRPATEFGEHWRGKQ